MTPELPGRGDRFRYQLDRFLSFGPAARFVGLLVLSLVLVLVGAVLVLVVMPARPEGTQRFDFLEALWWAMTRMLDAGTFTGDEGALVRFTGLLATLAGVGVVALLIGLVSSTIGEKLDDLRKGRSPVIDEGHTLILGAGEKLYAILLELKEANASLPTATVVILSERDKEEVETSVRERLGDMGPTRVVVRQGSTFAVHDLRKVGAGRARSIIVLSEASAAGQSERSDASDMGAIKTLLALRRISGALTRNHAVVELADDSRRAVLEQLGGGGIEVVAMRETLSRLMVQTARQSGLAQVYRDLMTFAGSEFYFKAFPQLAGRPFGKAQWYIEGAVVCGVRQKATGQTVLNPPDELVLQKGDELLVIAEDDDSFALVPAKEPLVPAGFTGAAAITRRPERLLVCGSSPKLADMLKELDQYVLPGSEAWLMPGWTREAFAEFLRAEVGTARHLRFKHVEGDPAVPQDLSKVVGPGFDVAMVVADTSRDQEEADARTVITVLLLRDLYGKLEGPRPRIISEILDPRTKDLLEQDEGADFVVSQEMTSMLLAQISERRELNAVFADLFDADGNELYLKRGACFAPEGQPTPWPIIQKVARRRKEVAIGYLQAGAKPVLNPPRTELVTLGASDRVIVIATDDSEAREDLRGGAFDAPPASPSLTRTRSGLLPPPEEDDARPISAGPRVKGPSTEPRPPLPGKTKG